MMIKRENEQQQQQQREKRTNKLHSNEREERTGGFTSGLFRTSHCVLRA